MIICFNTVRCHAFNVKISQIMSCERRAASCSYKIKTKLKAYRARERGTVSRALSVSTIREGVKHGQMRFSILSSQHLPTNPPTVLRRAPRGLESALVIFVDNLSAFVRPNLFSGIKI